jgi:CHRD domain/PEP-CTERM motif
MKRIPVIALIALISLATANTATAAIITFNVVLNGSQAVPANASTGIGSATVTVDDIADTVSVTMSFSGLTGGNASAAHIHCCVPTDANGPVVIPFTGFPSATSGTYNNLFTGISVPIITGIEAGQAYINIHNTVFPGGEIRGDILPAPEPTSLALMGLGILAIAARRYSRDRPPVRSALRYP